MLLAPQQRAESERCESPSSVIHAVVSTSSPAHSHQSNGHHTRLNMRANTA